MVTTTSDGSSPPWSCCSCAILRGGQGPAGAPTPRAGRAPRCGARHRPR
ncbi:hypothetical protein QJS66_05485 [Kocuria rhizophila]|nr:hypothetical protein QJS66_05485 [Kocuria rhizophila]